MLVEVPLAFGVLGKFLDRHQVDGAEAVDLGPQLIERLVPVVLRGFRRHFRQHLFQLELCFTHLLGEGIAPDHQFLPSDTLLLELFAHTLDLALVLVALLLLFTLRRLQISRRLTRVVQAFFNFHALLEQSL